MLLHSEANEIEFHRFAELNANNALEMCLQDELSWKYIPDHWSKPKARVDRRFLWIILATVKPDFTKMVLENAYKECWALSNQVGAREDF